MQRWFSKLLKRWLDANPSKGGLTAISLVPSLSLPAELWHLALLPGQAANDEFCNLAQLGNPTPFQ